MIKRPKPVGGSAVTPVILSGPNCDIEKRHVVDSFSDSMYSLTPEQIETSALVTSLVAIGSKYWEAVGQVASGIGIDKVMYKWENFIVDLPDSDEIVAVLDSISEYYPDGACFLLNDALKTNLMAGWEDNYGNFGLHLGGRDWIATISGDFKIRGSLNLDGCAGLTVVEHGISVGHNLFLSCCPIERLPEGIKVGKSLHMNNCQSLVALPDNLRVGEAINLSGCTSLKYIPNGFRAWSSMKLNGCTSLENLPSDLNVEDDLDLQHCTSIVSIPGDIEIGKSLLLVGCTSWDGKIPDGVKVKSLFTDRHPGGIKLAEWRKLHPNGELG